MAVARKRILLADDHPEFLDEVRSLLDPDDYEIAAELINGDALAEAIQELEPDLVISDISMPVMNGFECVSKIRSLGFKTKLIFLTVHSSPAYLRKAQSLGVQGYVLKICTTEQLLSAVSSVLAGGTFISPELLTAR